MAIGFTHDLTRDDTGETLATLSDQIAEGETKVYEVTVTDPKITGDISEKSTSAAEGRLHRGAQVTEINEVTDEKE